MQQNKLKAKGIFLDLDGTIVDSTNAYIEAARIAFTALDKPLPTTHVMFEIPRRIEQTLNIDDLTFGCTQKFMPIYLQAYHATTEKHAKLFPNTAHTIFELSKKAKLAVITMRHVPNEVIQKELDNMGIAQYFSHVMTSLDTAKPKPSPEQIILCAQKMGLEMEKCLIVGDSVNDVRAGKAAGAKTVAVLSGLYGKEVLAKEDPDLMLTELSLLPEHIE